MRYNVLVKFFFLGMLLMVFSFFYFHLSSYLTLDALRNDYIDIEQWTHLHYAAAMTLYMLIYIILIACTIPCATIFALLGGFLFGNMAIIYAVFCTTLGGMILFLSIRHSIGEKIAAKSSGWVKKLENGFQKNAFNYILSLRLMPIFPCWISNIAAGALNVPLNIFIPATVLGVFPATSIYVMAGKSLDKLLTTDEISVVNIAFTPEIFLPLLGLGFLSLFPVIYKCVKK